jgi:hypothetical protein
MNNNNAFVRAVCRVLIASMFWLPLQSQAELIATNRAVSAAQAQSARATLAIQLETFGIAADSARERVAALSDVEALDLAARVENAPAGGSIAWAAILLLIFLVWRFGFSEQAKADQKAREPAPQKEPAKK